MPVFIVWTRCIQRIIQSRSLRVLLNKYVMHLWIIYNLFYDSDFSWRSYQMLHMMICLRLHSHVTFVKRVNFLRLMNSGPGFCRVGADLSESTADLTTVCIGGILKWALDMIFVIESSLVDISLVKIVFFLVVFCSLSERFWISYIGGFVHYYQIILQKGQSILVFQRNWSQSILTKVNKNYIENLFQYHCFLQSFLSKSLFFTTIQPFKQVANDTHTKQGYNRQAEVGFTFWNQIIVSKMKIHITIMSISAALIIFFQKKKGDQAKFAIICTMKNRSPSVITNPVVWMKLTKESPIRVQSMVQAIGKTHLGGLSGDFLRERYQSQFLGIFRSIFNNNNEMEFSFKVDEPKVNRNLFFMYVDFQYYVSSEYDIN